MAAFSFNNFAFMAVYKYKIIFLIFIWARAPEQLFFLLSLWDSLDKKRICG
jgi:hypothetical protein